jgi:hypothetical protein
MDFWDVRKTEMGIDGRRESIIKEWGIKIKEQVINS